MIRIGTYSLGSSANFVLLSALAVACFLIPSLAAAQDTKPAVPAQYAATAIGQGGSTSGKTFGLNIYMDTLTDDSKIQELVGILKKNGQTGLVNALQDMKDVGRVAPNGSVGTGLRIVRMRPTSNGGSHIVLVTDRPISFGELYNSTRSRDYPITFIVMDLDKDGKGTGKFAPLCKVKFNKKNELEIENYGQKPFRLVNIYRQK